MSRWEVDMGEVRKIVGIIGLLAIYANSINRYDYPTFEDWKADMLKSGLIKEVK